MAVGPSTSVIPAFHLPPVAAVQIANGEPDDPQLPVQNNPLNVMAAPASSPATECSKEGEEIAAKQLEGVLDICKNLKNTPSINDLFSLSWAIGALPREKKFSKNWSSYISERDWLLLEDIARQLAIKYPAFPGLNHYQCWASTELAAKFAQELDPIIEVFTALKEGKEDAEKPVVLRRARALFQLEFDRYVLEQARFNVDLIIRAIGSIPPVKWLQDHFNVRAFFRVVEIVGESGKILSQATREQHPLLLLGGSNKEGSSLFSKLRDQLHHNKERCLTIAELAPEKWAALIPLMQRVLEKGHSQTDSDKATLEELYRLCAEERYNRMPLLWKNIKEDFEERPDRLIALLFGLEACSEKKFEEIWKREALPYLKEHCDEERNRNEVMSMLRISIGNGLSHSDIRALAPASGCLAKEQVVRRMKAALKRESISGDDELIRFFEEYNYLASQLVFLSKGKTVKLDVKKKAAIEKLAAFKKAQLKPFRLTWQVFKKEDGTLTELGRSLQYYCQLKEKIVAALIGEIRELLIEMEAPWKRNASTDEYKKEFKNKPQLIKKNYLLSKEAPFLGFPEGVDVNLKELKDFPFGRKVSADDLDKQKAGSLKVIEELRLFLDRAEEAIPNIEQQVEAVIRQLVVLSSIESFGEEHFAEVKTQLSLLNFQNSETFCRELASNGITDAKPADLSALARKVVGNAEAALHQNLDQELEEIASGAEELTAPAFIQETLETDTLCGNPSYDPKMHYSMLKSIHKTSSGGSPRAAAWNTIEAKWLLGKFPKNKRSKTLQEGVEKLRQVFGEVQNARVGETGQQLLLLCAEYEMQGIGESAELMKEQKVSVSSNHILSSQHLLKMGLMRKIMAHYPLSANPESMEWNFKYLAFDTRNVFLQRRQPSLPSSPRGGRRREEITFELAREKKFEIEGYFDRLNLKLDFIVLHPAVGTSEKTYLSPLGDFSILVFPRNGDQSKEDFIHSVMELELILCHLFNAEVTVVGRWKRGYINIPSQKYIPPGYIERVVNNGQPVTDWNQSKNSLAIFKEHPYWSKVVFKSGREVSQGDFKLHHDLRFFLGVLGFKWDSNHLYGSLNSSRLPSHIFERLKELRQDSLQCYAESTLFRWISCLYERFCPPRTTPNYPLCLPQSDETSRPQVSMIDSDNNGLLLLNKEAKARDLSQNASLKFYYRDGKRLDIYNGRSLLDAERPITKKELDEVSRYAAATIKNSLSYIEEMLNPDYGLDPAVFKNVARVEIADPALVPTSNVIDTVPPEIDAMIQEEAKEISSCIIVFIKDVREKIGERWTLAMLLWLGVEKEIEQLTRHYYGENRLRLTKPYISMDDFSKERFDELYLRKGSLCDKFSFINCSYQFFDLIDTESNRFSDGATTLSEKFKKAIPEEEMQEKLLPLINKRAKIINKFPFGMINSLNKQYVLWNKLFRMITTPQIFTLLIGRGRIAEQLPQAIAYDFTEQYKKPVAGEEYFVARTDNSEHPLFDLRYHFETRQLHLWSQDNHKLLVERLRSYRSYEQFSQEWRRLYNEDLSPTYFNDLLIEARTGLEKLVNKNPNIGLGTTQIEKLAKYWAYIKGNTGARMISIKNRSANTYSFKKAAEDNTFYGPEWKEDAEEVLRQCPQDRYIRLIGAYLNFFSLEYRFSNLAYYLKSRIESYNELTREKNAAEESGSERWEIRLYDQQLDYTVSCLQRAYTEFEELAAKMQETDFFAMLKLFAWQRHIMKNQENLEGVEKQTRAAFLLLTEEADRVPRSFADILPKIGMQPGAYFSLYYSPLKTLI